MDGHTRCTSPYSQLCTANTEHFIVQNQNHNLKEAFFQYKAITHNIYDALTRGDTNIHQPVILLAN